MKINKNENIIFLFKCTEWCLIYSFIQISVNFNYVIRMSMVHQWSIVMSLLHNRYSITTVPYFSLLRKIKISPKPSETFFLYFKYKFTRNFNIIVYLGFWIWNVLFFLKHFNEILKNIFSFFKHIRFWVIRNNILIVRRKYW